MSISVIDTTFVVNV